MPFPATVVDDEFPTFVVFETVTSVELVLLVSVELEVAVLFAVSTGVEVVGVVVLSKNLSKFPVIVEFELFVVRD